jgi:hypothetical protein
LPNVNLETKYRSKDYVTNQPGKAEELLLLMAIVVVVDVHWQQTRK